MAPSSTYVFPPRIALLDLEMAPSKSEAKMAAEDVVAEEERKCLASEAAEEGGNQMRGHQQDILCKI